MTINQVVPQDLWPSNIGRSVITLNLSPDTLAARYNIKFEEGLDDLDEYQLAALYHPLIGQIWLWKYNNSLDLDVMVDSLIDPIIAQEIIINLLSLDVSDISWLLNSDDIGKCKIA